MATRKTEIFFTDPFLKQLYYSFADGVFMSSPEPPIEATAPLILLSYDVSTTNRSAAARVAHLIFGRKDAPEASPRPYIRRPGVVWIGQSVFVLPQPLAAELAEKLHGLGAAVTMARVTIPPAEIEAFRRHSRDKPGA